MTIDIKMYKNKHISAYAQSTIDILKKQVLELAMENAELKDQVLDLGGEYKERWGSEPLSGNKKWIGQQKIW